MGKVFEQILTWHSCDPEADENGERQKVQKGFGVTGEEHFAVSVTDDTQYDRLCSSKPKHPEGKLPWSL